MLFKIINITVEVSQKTIFRDLIQAAKLHLSLNDVKMAEIRPFKNADKTLLVVLILPELAPCGLT